MNAQLAARKAKLESMLQAIAGVPVEITIRGERAFTWSLAAMNVAAADRLVRFATHGGYAKAETHHDAECGSFVYVEA